MVHHSVQLRVVLRLQTIRLVALSAVYFEHFKLVFCRVHNLSVIFGVV